MKYKLIKLKGNKSVLVDESAEIKENTYYENNGDVYKQICFDYKSHRILYYIDTQ